MKETNKNIIYLVSLILVLLFSYLSYNVGHKVGYAKAITKWEQLEKGYDNTKNNISDQMDKLKVKIPIFQN